MTVYSRSISGSHQPARSLAAEKRCQQQNRLLRSADSGPRHPQCSCCAAVSGLVSVGAAQQLTAECQPSHLRPCIVPRNTRLASFRLSAQLSDRELTIKLSIAQSTDRLDLSNCSLTELPPGLFDLTNLVELSLAGNQLTQLPSDISRLTSLERLVLAGNWLQHLPQQLWELHGLEGLWVHGNLLQDLPAQIGGLSKLKMLSVAGNCITSVPNSLTQLVHLQDLNLSGNQINQLPEGMCALTALTMLSLHGNQLQQIPQHGWEQLTDLKEVTLQGNRLTGIPDSFAQLRALTELSLADNQITSLPDDLSGWSNLQKFHCYSNRMKQLPLGPAGLPALLPYPAAANSSNGASTTSSSSSNTASSSGDWQYASNNGDSSYNTAANKNIRSVDLDDSAYSNSIGKLVSLWLEGNPLTETCVAELIQKMGPAGTTRIGLDQQQVVGAALQQYEQLKAVSNKSVRRGVIQGDGPGYFKLQLGPSMDAGSSSDNCSVPDDRVLVVAFGSAPGLPNWGGVMRQVYAAAEAPEHHNFDVLYVVDPHRSWYCGGDAALMQERYGARLQQYTQQYKHVVMIGDSMGATGALLFSPLATSVLSFCPQVDLTTASIRPGQPPEWQAALQQTLHKAVAASSARIRVFTGTWQHDIDQANLLSDYKHVNIKVYGVDSHRLALALARQRKLAPIIREAVLGEMGINSGNVRLVNLL